MLKKVFDGMMRALKLQSAMEYLMTYGWVLLVVGVVIIALFYLNVFSPYYLAPKALTGSCSVNRPLGTNSTVNIGLVGLCNNMIPKFALYYNKNNPYATIGISSLNIPLEFQNSATVTAWINPAVSQGVSCIPSATNPCIGWIFAKYSDWGLAVCSMPGGVLELCYYYWQAPGFATSEGYLVVDTNAVLKPGSWYFVSEVVSGACFGCATTGRITGGPGTITIYINGSDAFGGVGVGGVRDTIPNVGWIPDIAGGSYVCCGQSFEGAMSNVQLYNTTLSQNSIQALYVDGIGGAPINLQNIQGWWPLNGDVNDYSGNRYDAITGNVFYTTDWYNGYVTPG